MTLPTTGQISALLLRAELGVGGAISLNQASVRSLAGKASGAISFADLRGKTGTGASGNMTVTAMDGGATGDATGTAFTAYARPRVTVTGGTAPITYTWTITVQDDSGFTLANANAATCEVAHSIGKYGYIGQCSLTCVVSDNAGNTTTKTGIYASFDYQQKSGGQVN